MRVVRNEVKDCTVETVSIGVPFRLLEAFHPDSDKDGPFIKCYVSYQYCLVHLVTGKISWISGDHVVIPLEAHIVVEGDK